MITLILKKHVTCGEIHVFNEKYLTFENDFKKKVLWE
jgi:hypothetical protein